MSNLPNPTAAQVAELKSLKPGTPIIVEVNAEKKKAKFELLASDSLTSRFKVRISGRISWHEGHQYAGLDKPVESIATPLERGINYVKLLVVGSDKPAFAALKAGEVYPVVNSPEQHAKYKADVWIMGAGEAVRLLDNEWMPASSAKTYDEEISRAMDEAGPEPKKLHRLPLSAFSSQVMQALSELEEKGEPVQSKALAAHMGEAPLKVAGSFTNLAKMGLLAQAGEHGARTVAFTDAGKEWIGPKPAKEDFALTDEVVSAMSKVSGPNGAAVADIFVANLLTHLQENRPDLLSKSATTVEGAYFNAQLTEAGRAYLLKAAPEWIEHAVEARHTEQQPAQIEASESPAKRKRGRPRIHPIKDKTKRGQGGRPAPGTKSIREQVLLALKEHTALGELSQSDIVKDVTVKLKLVSKMPVQNAVFKLGRMGYLETSDTGKLVNPLKLTAAGSKGYSINSFGSVKVRLLEMIEVGKSDAYIARILNVDDTYVKKLRSKGTNLVTEAVTE